MRLNYAIPFVIMLMPFTSSSQHKKEHTNMVWEGYYNTIHFGKNWSLLSDAQIRTRDWTQQWSQLLVRSGLSYKINDHFSITGGFAFFKNAQYTNKDLFFKNEWRPWQELFYQLKVNRINFSQRIRTEQRFLQEIVDNEKSKTYQYVSRLRYRFDWQLPLEKEKIIFLIGNEVLVNPGCISNTSFFDQNRSFAGLNFKLHDNAGLQFQYVKIFQWRGNTAILEDQNVIRVNLFQQLSYRKNPKSK